MANLYPEGYEAEAAEAAQLTASAPVGFRGGVLFDYEAGDFPRDGRNRLKDCTGLESWQAWAVNCMQTERYQHLAYGTDFGLETTAAFQAATRQEAEAILTREITEAMLADPYGRTQYVEDIAYDWTGPDEVTITVTLHGLEDVTIDVTAYITRGGRG